MVEFNNYSSYFKSKKTLYKYNFQNEFESMVNRTINLFHTDKFI